MSFDEWSQGLQVGRTRHAALALDETRFLICGGGGGSYIDARARDDCELCDTATRSCAEGPRMPLPLNSGSGLVLGGAPFVAGQFFNESLGEDDDSSKRAIIPQLKRTTF